MYEEGQELEEFAVTKKSDTLQDIILLPASCLSNEELVNHLSRYNSALAAEVKKRIGFYFTRLEYLENELKNYE